MPAPSPNQEIIDAEARAEARRAEERKRAEAEAAAEVERQIAEAKAKQDIEAAKAALRPQLASRCADLSTLLAEARKEPEKLRERLRRIETRLGDLEGAITTARDVGRHDPARALAALDRAEKAFKANPKS